MQKYGGTWAARLVTLVKLTRGFGSSHDLGVVRWSPASSSTLHGEIGLSRTPSAPRPTHILSLSPSLK